MDIRWLIYSREHNAWWRPHESGYTTLIDEAGRYNLMQARKIIRQANIAQPENDVHEFMMLAPEAVEAIADEFEEMGKNLKKMGDGLDDLQRLIGTTL